MAVAHGGLDRFHRLVRLAAKAQRELGQGRFVLCRVPEQLGFQIGELGALVGMLRRVGEDRCVFIQDVLLVIRDENSDPTSGASLANYHDSAS